MTIYVYLARHLLLVLPVLTRGVPPLDVLVGGLVQVLLNVVEGVLGNVGNTQVGVLPDSAVVRLQLACRKVKAHQEGAAIECMSHLDAATQECTEARWCLWWARYFPVQLPHLPAHKEPTT